MPHFPRDLKIRGKLLAAVLPLVVLPVLGVGAVVGYVAMQQAREGITQAVRADLEHLSQFTLDLLNAHHQQFEVYKEDKRRVVYRDLATLARFAYNLVAVQHEQYANGQHSLEAAQQEARKAFKNISVGETGYLYAMTSKGELTIHIAQEGQNVYGAQDDTGRHFIQEICETAVAAKPGEVLYIVYPWRNEILGERRPRNKVVAYLYFPAWDWIIAAGGYLDETYEDVDFERQALRELQRNILSKPVGSTGYIYAMTRRGELKMHPFQQGRNIYDARDRNGHYFIQEMCARQNGWIRYPWRNENDPAPRMKIVRYRYFAPWDWIVAVGAYEDEFYQPATAIEKRILSSMGFLTLVAGVLAVLLVLWVSKLLTDPIQRLMAGVRQVRQGRLDTRLPVTSNDELGELAADFNRMTDALRQNKALEANLAQRNKMASLGVLSAEVAHEINNPLGVILGYAAHLESKLDPQDPALKYVQEIRRESKRCKHIVQDLLSYARVPKPALEETDLNALLDRIVDFAAHHTDMHAADIVTAFDPDLPRIQVDGDQIRQVAMNLMLNAGAAMPEGGRLTVGTGMGEDGWLQLTFQDSGCGIAPDNLEKIFEPFFTTKTRGTGLGLAIAKTIVDQHGGRIDIASAPGQGTGVTVRLPIRREPA
ncbi:MAG: cache domain-containing protein [Candidatus Competibacter sp.]|nr:cache domain-containing protein [Candidatus Competibacter sp.]MDG4582930.1 cache domain-containing protein [Candidatus Competibacter sp.]